MPSKRPGGKSVRYDSSVPNDLHKAVAAKMKELGMDKPAEAVRRALAEWVGQPDLAEGVQPGRRWPKNPKQRKYRTKE